MIIFSILIFNFIVYEKSTWMVKFLYLSIPFVLCMKKLGDVYFDGGETY